MGTDALYIADRTTVEASATNHQVRALAFTLAFAFAIAFALCILYALSWLRHLGINAKASFLVINSAPIF